MNLRDFSFLTDENIHPAVVADLRARGCDVLDVREAGLRGAEDVALLQLAYSTNRVVLTHDRDFGGLSIARLEPLVGIVFLRPGHINPRFTIDTLNVLFGESLSIEPPFFVVAKRNNRAVTIRVRHL